MESEKHKYEQLNDAAAAWAKQQSGKMRQLVSGLTLKDKEAVRKAVWAARKATHKPLTVSIGTSLKKEFEQVNRINFRFQRHGIFLEHGVGKGRSKKNPKPWLVPVLDPAIRELADILAGEHAEVAERELKFFIPGILDRKIKIENG